MEVIYKHKRILKNAFLIYMYTSVFQTCSKNVMKITCNLLNLFNYYLIEFFNFLINFYNALILIFF